LRKCPLCLGFATSEQIQNALENYNSRQYQSYSPEHRAHFNADDSISATVRLHSVETPAGDQVFREIKAESHGIVNF